ncbi:phage tail protein [Pasteurella skyensis]|uniref:phage tail-collar fiber domain-containing protein n=1 Tax=Phocoenobacter skyensis TaxID=97481 RepID=UPI002764B705|nr:phage tail protein [Pasteurella skyensis]MDP8176356.1 phage tail protein [Pasteurella skyensis]MDP8199131.1 phage tail protein [Pasteurella skyensis]
MSKKYYSILTQHGETVLANTLGNQQKLSNLKMAVGDGAGNETTPTATQTALVNSRYSANITKCYQDPKDDKQAVFELQIPENVGGFYVRELGLLDENNKLIAVANTPESYKPRTSEGSGKVSVFRLILRISHLDNVELNIDASTVYLTALDKSDRVDLDSSETVGSSKAVKTAYDKAVEAKELADNKVSRNGDTMKGGLSIKSGEDYNSISLFNKKNKRLMLESMPENPEAIGYLLYREVNGINSADIKIPKTSGTMATTEDIENTTQFLRRKIDDTFYGNLISVPKNKSLCGSYDPTKIDQIWSMGIDYTVSGDGSNFGNLYGLAYKYSSTEMAIGHQIILCHDGSPRVALGKNIWAKNGVDIEGNIKNSKFAGWGVSINLSAPTSLISNGKVGLGIHQNGNMYFVDEKNKKYFGYFDQHGLEVIKRVKTPILEFSNGAVLKAYNNDWVHLSKKLYLTNKEAHSIYTDGGIFAKKSVETDGYIESRCGISTKKSKSEFLNSWKYAIELLDGDSIIGLKGETLGIGFNSNGNIQVIHKNGSYIAQFGENGDSIFNKVVANKIHIENQSTDDRYVRTSDFKIAELTTENLNAITANGFYAQKSSASASPSLNYPTQEAGTLIVMPSAHISRQEYRTYASNKVFFRNNNSAGSWREWQKINTEVKILTGNIKHGGVIPLPAGYTQEQCKWMVTPHKMWDNVSSNDMLGFHTYADENRVVTCLVEHSVSDMSSADYIIIGVK